MAFDNWVDVPVGIDSIPVVVSGPPRQTRPSLPRIRSATCWNTSKEGGSPDEISSEAGRDHVIQPLSVDSGLVGRNPKLFQDYWFAGAILGFGVIDDPIGTPLQLVSILTPVVGV